MTVTTISSLGIRLSASISPFDSSIVVLLGVATLLFTSRRPSRTIPISKESVLRILVYSVISATMDCNSTSNLPFSKPVSLCKRISRIALICGAVSLYLPPSITPVLSDTNSIIPLTSSEGLHVRSLSAAAASAASLDALMIATISSMFKTAMYIPINRCARSLTFFRRYLVLRTKTSFRKATNVSIISINDITRGLLLSRTNVFILKLVLSGVRPSN
ncbi:hypothetical protein ANAPH1_00255 [Anaplasma phagocytophilum]|nr:hypothetical protein ANAPH1_00255 [Anaplasma phagocytophilum]